MSSFAERICFAISHFMVSKNALSRYQHLTRVSEDRRDLDNWSDNSLRRSLEYFSHIPIRDQIVLDFGCGNGKLSFRLKERGAASVYGVDLNSAALARARDANSHGPSVEFLLGGASSIPLPSESVDLIFCISVLEHIMDVDSILREWYRVLRPGGKVLIQWSAWHHADGSHLDSVIPIPYAQCLFSERTLARTAARIKRSRAYKPKVWDYDPETGLLKEFRLEDEYTRHFLNKMSIGSFNGKLKQINLFETSYYKCHPPSWLPRLQPLLRVPFFREHLTSFVGYILTKPAAAASCSRG
jgi:ubiquinone/menaquinone biosynthesis C-methylase UbiE